jgi:uncharacterized membrane protein YheB (UPF0754 family)
MNLRLLINLSPLVVATLHGYGAAWLAVRMLFRPRHPIFAFGWQLPLTPGLLPKERDRFISALSSIIAQRLLSIEVIADELMKLDLETEIAALAQREVASYTQNETAVRVITDHLRERLTLLSGSEEAKMQIVHALREIIDRETTSSGFWKRLAAGYLMDEQILYRIIGGSLEKLSESVSESLYVRETISQAMVQLPQRLLAGGGKLVPSTAISSLVQTLSQRLDIQAILRNRLSGFSNEDIERLVMDTAGREIRAIVWFGAGIGLIVGIVQTLINFI